MIFLLQVLHCFETPDTKRNALVTLDKLNKKIGITILDEIVTDVTVNFI